MESPKIISSRWCKNLTYLCGTANDPASCKPVEGRERKFAKIRVSLSHGTMFAPKQCLYQKEAMGIETQKMYSSRRCKNLTYLCGTANDPISSKAV